MDFTESHAKQIQETHDLMVALKPMIESHNKTLYGNGQPGLEKDHLTFKTQVKTALVVISVFFTGLITILKLLK